MRRGCGKRQRADRPSLKCGARAAGGGPRVRSPRCGALRGAGCPRSEEGGGGLRDQFLADTQRGEHQGRRRYGGGGGSVRARLCLKWGEGGGGGKKKRNNAAPDILCSKCALPPPSPRYLISVATAAKGSGELEESLHGGNFVLGERGGAVGEGWRGVGGRRGGARRGHYATCAERCAE